MTSSAGTFYVKLLHSHTETWLKMIEARDTEIRAECAVMMDIVAAEFAIGFGHGPVVSGEEIAGKIRARIPADWAVAAAPPSDVQGKPKEPKCGACGKRHKELECPSSTGLQERKSQ
mgnify:CR=1 FL=1